MAKPVRAGSADETAKVPSVSAFAATEALEAYEIPDFDLSLPEPPSSSSMNVADGDFESVRDLATHTADAAAAMPLEIPALGNLLPATHDNEVRVRDQSALLVDVTPLSLRVETVAGYSEPLIASNTAIPCDQTRVFYTARDNQTRVAVRVAQGEASRFSENTFLGEVELDGIAPGRRGEVRISVTFELDVDGLAAATGLSRAHFFTLFQRDTRVTPLVYANVLRFEAAVQRLTHSQEPVGDVSHELGFSTPSHFSRFFRAHLGITPSDYRRKVNLFEPPDGPGADVI